MNGRTKKRTTLLSMAVGAVTMIMLAVPTAANANPSPLPFGGPFTWHNGNSDLCLEIPGSSTTMGTVAAQWECNGTYTQQWFYMDAWDGFGKIVNVNSGMCLEPYGTADGAVVRQWQCDDSQEQKWVVYTAPSGGGWKMYSVDAGLKALEIRHDSKEWGAQANIWTSNSSATQRWWL